MNNAKNRTLLITYEAPTQHNEPTGVLKMATSTCIKCNSTTFEVKETKVIGSPHIILFIQCSSCGGVVGLIDAKHDAILERLFEKIR